MPTPLDLVAPVPNDDVSRGHSVATSPRPLTGLASSADVIDVRNKESVRDEASLKRSTVMAALASPIVFVEDATEVMRNVPVELMRGRSVWKALTSGDRMRGLGTLLVVAGLVGLMIA